LSVENHKIITPFLPQTHNYKVDTPPKLTHHHPARLYSSPESVVKVRGFVRKDSPEILSHNPDRIALYLEFFHPKDDPVVSEGVE
jgi:hypothetical protein